MMLMIITANHVDQTTLVYPLRLACLLDFIQ